MEKTLTAINIILLIASVALWGFVVGTLQPKLYTTDHEVAEAICDYSATIQSREWEEACGMALDIIEGRN